MFNFDKSKAEALTTEKQLDISSREDVVNIFRSHDIRTKLDPIPVDQDLVDRVYKDILEKKAALFERGKQLILQTNNFDLDILAQDPNKNFYILQEEVRHGGTIELPEGNSFVLKNNAVLAGQDLQERVLSDIKLALPFLAEKAHLLKRLPPRVRYPNDIPTNFVSLVHEDVKNVFTLRLEDFQINENEYLLSGIPNKSFVWKKEK